MTGRLPPLPPRLRWRSLLPLPSLLLLPLRSPLPPILALWVHVGLQIGGFNSFGCRVQVQGQGLHGVGMRESVRQLWWSSFGPSLCQCGC